MMAHNSHRTDNPEHQNHPTVENRGHLPNCPQSDVYRRYNDNGYILNEVRTTTGAVCQSLVQTWLISGLPGQRILLTLYDFSADLSHIPKFKKNDTNADFATEPSVANWESGAGANDYAPEKHLSDDNKFKSSNEMKKRHNDNYNARNHIHHTPNDAGNLMDGTSKNTINEHNHADAVNTADYIDSKNDPFNGKNLLKNSIKNSQIEERKEDKEEDGGVARESGTSSLEHCVPHSYGFISETAFQTNR